MKLDRRTFVPCLILAAGACTRPSVPAAPPSSPDVVAIGTPPFPPIAPPTPRADAPDAAVAPSVAHETRQLADFTRVTNTTSLDLHIVPGTAFVVVVTAEPSVLPAIETTVTNGVLTIRSNRPFTTHVPSYVDVALPLLAGITSEGSGDVSATVTQAQAVALANHGSGDLAFAGQTGAVTLDLGGSGSTTLTGSGASLTGANHGSGNLTAEGFPVGAATYASTGSSSASLTVRGNANLRVTGSGDIRARIDQGTADLAVEGSGSITWSGSAVVSNAASLGSGRIVHNP